MKKILLSLFIVGSSIISFGYCENYSFTLSKSCYSIQECAVDSHVFVPITSGSVISCSLTREPNVSNVSGDVSFVIRSNFIEGLSNDCGIETWDFFDNTWFNGSWNYGGGLQESFELTFYSFGDSDTSLQDISLSMDLSSVHSINGQVNYGVSCIVSNSFSFNSCNLLSSDESISCDYSGYILESEINSGYCLVNGLCPSSEICNDGDYSNVFMYSNNRYFPITGTNNIYVNLPSYLGYDYDYSNGGNDLDIDIGMVVDENYIDGLNAVQNYKPSSDDFTGLVSTLAPYSKILIFCVFIFIIWAWIKKPFKSKKL